MRKRGQLLRFSAGVMSVGLCVAVAQQGGSAHAAVMASVVATSQFENLNNMVRGETGTYAGLWVDDASNTVYVSTTDASVTPATVEAMTPRVVSGEATMNLAVVHAQYNFAQLEAIAGRVMYDKGLLNAAEASHSTLSEWYPDPITDKVVIAFTKVTAAEQAEVSAEYGTTARVVAAPVSYSAVGTAADTPKVISPHTRTADSFPWYGGDRIVGSNGLTCTAGFDWSGNSMTTAGHCGATSWDNNGGFVGYTFTLQWGNNRIDMQRMNGSTYDPLVWAGASGNTAEPVSGSGGVALGQQYCTNGSFTGQNCNAKVYAIDACVSETWKPSNVDVCDLDEAEAADLRTKLVQPGDSGGPVYVNTSIYSPYAVGTISAMSCNGVCVRWSDMYMEKQIFGGAPAVGT